MYLDGRLANVQTGAEAIEQWKAWTLDQMDQLEQSIRS